MHARTSRTAHKNQAVYHRPVAYLADPDQRPESASSDLEVGATARFSRSTRHGAKRVQRLLFSAKGEPEENRVDLGASPVLVDAMWKPRPEPEGRGFVRAGAAEYSAVDNRDVDGP